MGKILNIEKVQKDINKFCEERNWQQFHTPKNIAMALSVEASELLEHFQWLSPEDSIDLDEESKLAVSEEVSDVLVYLLRLSDLLDIDIPLAVERKMKLNAKKYPVEKSFGSSKKYTKL